MTPILIMGLPRSGTTWVGEVLSSSRNTNYIFEPDNEKLSPLAWLCKNELHRFPYLTLQDTSPSYDHLWRTALFSGQQIWFANKVLSLWLRKNSADVESLMGNKTGYVYVDESIYKVGNMRKPYDPKGHPALSFFIKRLLVEENRQMSNKKHRTIVKSVHALLSADWITSRFPVKIVFVLRNPYSLYASYKRLKMPDGFRNLLFQETLQRDRLKYMPSWDNMLMTGKEDVLAYQIMLIYKIIEEQVSRHPEWMLISHDRLCMTPHESYNHAFVDLGLHWSSDTDIKIDELNKTGNGFTPKRISSQQPSKWKAEMSPSEKSIIQNWIDKFELNHFFQQYIDLD